jgi:hypothetical protein
LILFWSFAYGLFSQNSLDWLFENEKGFSVELSQNVILVGIGSICCSPCFKDICDLYRDSDIENLDIYFYFDTWVPVYDRPNRIAQLNQSIGGDCNCKYVFSASGNTESMEQKYNLGYQSPFLVLKRKTKIRLLKHSEIWEEGVLSKKFRTKYKQMFKRGL